MLSHRLTDKAKTSLEKSKTFEKISPHVQRPSDLVDMYRNLYSDSRVHALDGVERAIHNSGRSSNVADIKNKLLFSVIVVRYILGLITVLNPYFTKLQVPFIIS